MKVTTDACLFGAWLAHHFHDLKGHAVDIGAGTGLLSLMIAQKNPELHIDAVELDPAASAQALQNLETADFEHRIRLKSDNILNTQFPYPFKLIFSNPPFYQNQLRSKNTDRNHALHENSLTIPDVLNWSAERLDKDGMLALLTPAYRETEVLNTAAKFGFYPNRLTRVKQTENHTPFRLMMVLDKNQKSGLKMEEITIKDIQQQYSATFAALLEDYYLKL